MNPNLFIMDDPVTDAKKDRDPAEMRRLAAEIDAAIGGFVRGGEYRNRIGEKVTWKANADGSYVSIQTWPEGTIMTPVRPT